MPPPSAVGESGQATMPPPSAVGESGQMTLPPPSTQAVAAAVAAQPDQPRKKKSKLPLILGILFVLLLLGAGGAVAGYFFLLRPMLAKKHLAGLEPRRPQPTPNVVSTPDVGNKTSETPKSEVPPYTPPANAVHFVNSNAKLTGKLAEHYVDFSFYYPKDWQKDPQAGIPGATNFVQVERRLPPNYTLENFAVGWYGSAGSAELDRTAFPRLAENLSSKFEKTIDHYRKVSEHETKVGSYDAYEFRFEGLSQMTDKGQFKIWGVAVFVPPVNGGNDGVTLLMLATSLAQELKSVNDVGVKGELPMMLDSFRFGK
jgi:flagellar basal body-associated protein FliL